MKYCNKCGARLLENTQICRKCGKRVEHMPIIDILLYILGVLFFVIGFVDIVSEQSSGLADLWMCLAGLTILPLPYKIVELIIKHFKKDYKNNNFLIIFVRILLPLIFLILMILFYKSYVEIVESDVKDEYVEVFDMNGSKVYFYGLSEFNVLVGRDYISIGKAYEQNNGVISELLEMLMLDTEYEDGAKLYKNKTYSMLKCDNGDLVIGNSKLKFEKGFCGKDSVPLEVSDKKVEDDEESKKDSEDNKETSNGNQNDNKTEQSGDEIGTGREDASKNEDEGANTSNISSNNKDESQDKEEDNKSNISASSGVISHQKLFDVYYNNMLDGSNKYFGKKIKVSTIFKFISKESNGSYILNMEHLYCTSYSSNKVINGLADLNRGQTIIVTGTVNEWNEEESSLELRNCEITNK